nr:30S ribosomal protein S13 [Cavernulicola chilensis]
MFIMPRSRNIILDSEKLFPFALASTYGIGLAEATRICCRINISKFTRSNILSSSQILLLHQFIDKYNSITSTRYSIVQNNIKNLKKVGCYKGIRHFKNLPVRGQRTRSNASTVKKLSF